MPLRRDEVLILRNIRMGDTSRVVTFLGRSLGRCSGVAKGCRDPRSRFGASLEILSVSSLVLYFRQGRDLQFLSEGFLEREHRRLLQSPRRYAHACALIEFLDRSLEDEEPVPAIYDLALRALALMEGSPEPRLEYILRAFQLRSAAWLGYAPRLDGCILCGRAEADRLDAAAGGLICRDCGGENEAARRTAPETIALARSILAGSLPRSPEARACAQLAGFVDTFLDYHLDRYRGMRSLRSLESGGAEAPGGSGPVT